MTKEREIEILMKDNCTKAEAPKEKNKIMMKAVNIKWDTDGYNELLCMLPTEMKIPKGMTDEDEISDWLSNEVGFCHNGFELTDGANFK